MLSELRQQMVFWYSSKVSSKTIYIINNMNECFHLCLMMKRYKWCMNHAMIENEPKKFSPLACGSLRFSGSKVRMLNKRIYEISNYSLHDSKSSCSIVKAFFRLLNQYFKRFCWLLESRKRKSRPVSYYSCFSVQQTLLPAVCESYNNLTHKFDERLRENTAFNIAQSQLNDGFYSKRFFLNINYFCSFTARVASVCEFFGRHFPFKQAWNRCFDVPV